MLEKEGHCQDKNDKDNNHDADNDGHGTSIATLITALSSLMVTPTNTTSPKPKYGGLNPTFGNL